MARELRTGQSGWVTDPTPRDFVETNNLLGAAIGCIAGVGLLIIGLVTGRPVAGLAGLGMGLGYAVVALVFNRFWRAWRPENRRIP